VLGFCHIHINVENTKEVISMCKKIVVPILLVLSLLLVLSPAIAFGAETQYPQGVPAAKESVVEVIAWIDGTVSGGAGWSIDARSRGPWSFDARGAVQFCSGFFVNEDGDVMTAAHAVDLSDRLLAEGAIMYFLGGIWYEDEWYEELDFGTFYNYLYWWAWELWLDDELEVTAREVDYVYRLGDDEAHIVQDIRFREDPETGMDIAILTTGLTDTPYIELKDATPPEGSQAYVIGYAGIDIIMEYWQAMDDIMEDPRERPDTFRELMRKAEDRMLECLRKEGPSVEVGLLGSTTRIYGMDARRFHGTTWGGFSGGPIVDEFGNCLGLLPWGAGDSRGYFIPSKDLNDASRQAGINTFPVLEIGSVKVEPSIIEAGQSFKATVEVSNLGFVKGDYTATLKLSDGTESSQKLTLEGGESKTVVISAVKKSPGFSTGSIEIVSTGNIEIGKRSIDFIVNPIEISNLTIKPTQVLPDELIKVQAEVSNKSEEQSTIVVSLSIDGQVEATKTLTLGGGATETVAFVVTRDTPGTYEVTVRDLEQSFTVVAVEPPPTLTTIQLIIAIITGLLAVAGIAIGTLAFLRSRK